MKSTRKLQEEREKLIERREAKKEEHKLFLQDINAKIKEKEDEIKQSFAEKIIKNLQIKDFSQFADAEKEITNLIGDLEVGEDKEEKGSQLPTTKVEGLS